jgi:RNA polymerase sigma-70 factor (ECF subfamily)
MIERTDAELVARARAGDLDAFAALVNRHRGAIVRLARRLVVSVDDAQDVAQEAFVSAFQNLATLRDGARFGAWLRRIAVNAARQRWRQGEQLSLEVLWDDGCATWPENRVVESAGELRTRVWDALAALPPEPRSAVLLHYFDGYDYVEMAALLQVPVSTVRGRLYLARRQLREEMRELAPPKKKAPSTPPATWEFALTTEDLQALCGAQLLASREASRPALQAICAEPDGTLVATDTHRLFVHRGSALRPPSRLLVSSGLFEPLRHRSYLTGARLSIVGDEATLRYTDGSDAPPERVHHAPVSTGQEYPRYERVIPSEWRVTASLGARDLLAALEEVARFEAFLAASARPDAGDDRLRVQLRFVESSGSVAIESVASKSAPTSVRWSIRTEIPVLLKGPGAGAPVSLSLNRHFLRECLEAMTVAPRESVEIRFNSPVSPIMVRPKEDESRFTLLMPLRPLLPEAVELAV